MKHGAVRKLTRAAALSFLVLATTSSVAGLEVLTATSAMAEPGSQGAGSDQGTGSGDTGGATGGATGGNNGGSAGGNTGGNNGGLPVLGGVLG